MPVPPSADAIASLTFTNVVVWWYRTLLVIDGRILAGREVAGARGGDGEEGTKAAGKDASHSPSLLVAYCAAALSLTLIRGGARRVEMQRSARSKRFSLFYLCDGEPKLSSALTYRTHGSQDFLGLER